MFLDGCLALRASLDVRIHMRTAERQLRILCCDTQRQRLAAWECALQLGRRNSLSPSFRNYLKHRGIEDVARCVVEAIKKLEVLLEPDDRHHSIEGVELGD